MALFLCIFISIFYFIFLNFNFLIFRFHFISPRIFDISPIAVDTRTFITPTLRAPHTKINYWKNLSETVAWLRSFTAQCQLDPHTIRRIWIFFIVSQIIKGRKKTPTLAIISLVRYRIWLPKRGEPSSNLRRPIATFIFHNVLYAAI